MIKKLLAIRLRSMFLSGFSAKDKKGNPSQEISYGKLVGFVLLFALLGILLLFAAFSIAMGMAMLFVPNGGEDVYFGLIFIISVSALFLLSIFETKSELFECKDNELLLSLPIKSRDIVLSRIFSVLTVNYIIQLMISVPSIVAYLIFGGNIIGVLGSAVAIIFQPLLASSLAAGVGYLVALISRKMRFKTLLTVVLSTLFLVIYIGGYTFFMESIESGFDSIEANIESVIASMKPIGVIGSAFTFSPLSLLAVIAITAATSFLAYYFISKNFSKIVSFSGTSYKAAYKEKRTEKRSAFSAVVRNEFARIRSSATYMLNGGSGIIFSIVIAAAIIMYSGELNTFIIELAGVSEAPSVLISPILSSAIVFGASMNMFSASALSLEGKNLWIIKSIPLKSRDVLLAKTVPHIVISGAVGILSAIVFSVATSAGILVSIIYLLIAVAANVAFGFLGLLLNIAKPKFDFINEAQAVKQSFPVFISMMIGMFFSLILFVAAIIFVGLEMPYLFDIVLLVLLSALSVAFYFIIVSSASGKLDKIQI